MFLVNKVRTLLQHPEARERGGALPQTPLLGHLWLQGKERAGRQEGREDGRSYPPPPFLERKQDLEGEKGEGGEGHFPSAPLTCMHGNSFLLSSYTFPSLGAKPKSEEDFLSAINVYPFPES